MIGSHDSLQVGLLIAIAVLTSFTALSVAARIRTSPERSRRLWLDAAALACGGSIWSMHFVAMLAFGVAGMKMNYDPLLTLVSLGVALLFTRLCFGALNAGAATRGRIVGAGLLMGSGVLAMHFIGMTAMRMSATLSYGRTWLAVSVLIAVGAVIAGLWLAARDRKPLPRLIAACIIGVAVVGIPFAGMRAAIFSATGPIGRDHGTAGIGQGYLAAVVGTITFLGLVLVLGAAQAGRMLRSSAQREARAMLRLRVADILRGTHLSEALEEVAGLLVTHFAVARAGYAQLDPLQQMFDYDVCSTDGTVSALLGRYPAAAFGVRIVAALNAGRTVVIDDLLVADLSDETRTRQTARDVDTRAILVVPFLREGRLRTIVYLNARDPRRWSSKDVAFMEEIADRTRLVIERVAVEDQLRDLNTTLEAKVTAEVAARLETEDALRQSQKVETIGQLTGGVAHDFNNFLTVIRGSVDLLRQPGLSDERRSRYIDAIADTADRAARLTGQLLAFARRQTLRPETFDVAANLDAIREMVGTLLGSRIALSIDAPDEPVFIDADAGQFDTAIVNMAVNARDAMNGAGAINLRVGTAQSMPAITAGLPVAGDFVTVAITDQGTGIAAEDMRRIFEPFYTTKGVGEGTGLGLSQVVGFAKQSGGDVAVESRAGQGTTFTLYLPRAAPPTRPVSPSMADVIAPVPDRAICVLLIEDNPDVGRFATTTLDELGYRTVHAGNAAAAMAELEKDADRFDVLFSDVVMPGMGGIELAKLVRARHPDLPILLTSGYSHVLAEEGSSGFDLLPKPYSIEQLSKALSRVARPANPRRPPAGPRDAS